MGSTAIGQNGFHSRNGPKGDVNFKVNRHGVAILTLGNQVSESEPCQPSFVSGKYSTQSKPKVRNTKIR